MVQWHCKSRHLSSLVVTSTGVANYLLLLWRGLLWQTYISACKYSLLDKYLQDQPLDFRFLSSSHLLNNLERTNYHPHVRESGIQHISAFGIRNPEAGIQNPASGIQNPAVPCNPEYYTSFRNPYPLASHLNLLAPTPSTPQQTVFKNELHKYHTC